MRSICLLGLWLHAACGADFHVAPGGGVGGDGSKERPWDLGTALGGPPSLKPGDTVWVADGVYRGGFKSRLAGKKDAPITVRAAGERAVIDCRPRDAKDSGAFAVGGEWTRFWGLEFTCSDPQRETQEKGSWPPDIRRGSIDSRGANISFINLVVHDLSNGFGFWGDDQIGEGGEIYGCLIYHNGWRGPDRGHGHGIYAQNARGTKRIVDNVIFNQFGHGVQVYGSEKAFLRHFHIEGNVAFNNGSLTRPGHRTADFTVGGGTAMEDVTFVNNFTYGGGLRLGYATDVQNRGIVARGNYLASSARVSGMQQLTFQQNTVIAPGTLVNFHPMKQGEPAEIAWDENRYHRLKTQWAAFTCDEKGKPESLTFAAWQKRAGFDGSSHYEEGAVPQTEVFVRPNAFEKGRAHIIVYNWQRQPAVEVNLDKVLARGERYRIVSAANPAGEPVLTGLWQGESVRLPIEPVKPVQPIGLPNFELPVSEPEFAVFLVLRAREA